MKRRRVNPARVPVSKADADRAFLKGAQKSAATIFLALRDKRGFSGLQDTWAAVEKRGNERGPGQFG